MLRRKNLIGSSQKALWAKIMIALSSMLLLAMNFTYIVQASLPSSLADILIPPITVDYPATPGIIGGSPVTVSGTGNQAVYRLGNGHVLGEFPPSTPCQTVIFLQGNQSTIGTNDFVYAFQVTYSGTLNAPMDTLQLGLCSNPRITSISYCGDGGIAPPQNGFNLLPLALDFFFLNPATIMTGQKSAILFYTSPDPPALAPTFIASSAVASQGIVPGTIPPLPPQPVQSPIYGPCFTLIGVVKELVCITPTGQPVTVNNGNTVTKGATLTYKFTATNQGGTELTNVVITDPALSYTSDAFLLPPGASVVRTFSTQASANGNFSNTAQANAVYDIPTQTGNPSGQTVPISATSNQVQFTVADTGLCGATIKCDTICFRSPILCQIFFNALPAGTILISGVNSNNPINIQTNSTLIRNALIPCPISFCTLTPLQYFNQQFVAWSH